MRHILFSAVVGLVLASSAGFAFAQGNGGPVVNNKADPVKKGNTTQAQQVQVQTQSANTQQNTKSTNPKGGAVLHVKSPGPHASGSKR